MIEYQTSDQFGETKPEERRVTSRKGRLRVNIAVNSFQGAVEDFHKAAEAFALSLSDPLHRKFAYHYLGYLKEIAHGSDQLKPNISGRPDCRLIGTELERIFRSHFFKPDEVNSKN